MESINGCHIQQGTEFFSLSLDTDISLNNITCFQVKSADLGRRYINIIFSGKIILTADKTIAVRKYLKDSIRPLSAVKLHCFRRNMILRTVLHPLRLALLISVLPAFWLIFLIIILLFCLTLQFIFVKHSLDQFRFPQCRNPL